MQKTAYLRKYATEDLRESLSRGFFGCQLTVVRLHSKLIRRLLKFKSCALIMVTLVKRILFGWVLGQCASIDHSFKAILELFDKAFLVLSFKDCRSVFLVS